MKKTTMILSVGLSALVGASVIAGCGGPRKKATTDPFVDDFDASKEYTINFFGWGDDQEQDRRPGNNQGGTWNNFPRRLRQTLLTGCGTGFTVPFIQFRLLTRHKPDAQQNQPGKKFQCQFHRKMKFIHINILWLKFQRV